MNKDSENHSNPPRRNTLGAPPEVYTQLLSHIDSEVDPPEETHEQRDCKRIEYIAPYIDITLCSREMSRNIICVAARNLSRSGIAILHSHYIHPGTSVTITLQRLDKSIMSVRGTIARCKHLSGIVHEAGIKFDMPIHPQELIRFFPLHAFRSLDQVDPSRLRGNLVVIGSNPELIKTVKDALVETEIKAQYIKSVDEYLEKDLPDDHVLLTFHDPPEFDGPLLAIQLRSSGFLGPLLLTGMAKTKCDQGSVQLSTADTFIPMPISKDDMLKALAEYMIFRWSEDSLEITRSFKDPWAVKLLRNEVAKLSVKLDQQNRTKNIDGVNVLCDLFDSIAPLIGSNGLTDLVGQIRIGLHESNDLESVQDQIRDICLLCA